ncbi:MAG: hypothetical protein PHT94_02065 [Candidatus Nanoarchaeia archaeon]|nr:hypothetical protein [Candidatus Nanoarchaeia archaeon]
MKKFDINKDLDKHLEKKSKNRTYDSNLKHSFEESIDLSNENNSNKNDNNIEKNNFKNDKNNSKKKFKGLEFNIIENFTHEHSTVFIIICAFLIIVISVILPLLNAGYHTIKQFNGQEMSSDEYFAKLTELENKNKELLEEVKNLDSMNKIISENLEKTKNESFEYKEKSKNLEQELTNLNKEFKINISEKEIAHKDEINNYIFQISQINQECEKKIQTEVNLIMNEKTELESDLQSAEFSKIQAEEKYNILAQNTARNICCKAKIDDSSIDSFYILQNMIVCSSDAENPIIC